MKKSLAGRYVTGRYLSIYWEPVNFSQINTLISLMPGLRARQLWSGLGPDPGYESTFWHFSVVNNGAPGQIFFHILTDR